MCLLFRHWIKYVPRPTVKEIQSSNWLQNEFSQFSFITVIYISKAATKNEDDQNQREAKYAESYKRFLKTEPMIYLE